MQTNKVLISCIIPVYNGEKFIEHCILSITNQKYQNLEIIVIDDGSNDNTQNIVKKLADKDNRIKLITQPINLGISSARNAGIEIALGEYIQFIDSDDELYGDFYNELNVSINNNIDIIIFDYYKFHIKSSIKQLKNRNIMPNVILSTYQEKLQILRHGGVVVWNKLYRTDLLKNNAILFIENILYEDIPFFWDAILYAKNIVYVKKALYLYIQRSDSIMNSKLSIIKAKDIVWSMISVGKILAKHNIQASQSIYLLFINRMLKTYTEFFRKLDGNHKQLFVDMSLSIQEIDLAELKNKLGSIMYFKLWILKKQKYKLYYIINLFKLRFWS